MMRTSMKGTCKAAILLAGAVAVHQFGGLLRAPNQPALDFPRGSGDAPAQPADRDRSALAWCLEGAQITSRSVLGVCLHVHR